MCYTEFGGSSDNERDPNQHDPRRSAEGMLTEELNMLTKRFQNLSWFVHNFPDEPTVENMKKEIENATKNIELNSRVIGELETKKAFSDLTSQETATLRIALEDNINMANRIEMLRAAIDEYSPYQIAKEAIEKRYE